MLRLKEKRGFRERVLAEFLDDNNDEEDDADADDDDDSLRATCQDANDDDERTRACEPCPVQQANTEPDAEGAYDKAEKECFFSCQRKACHCYDGNKKSAFYSGSDNPVENLLSAAADIPIRQTMARFFQSANHLS